MDSGAWPTATVRFTVPVATSKKVTLAIATSAPLGVNTSSRGSLPIGGTLVEMKVVVAPLPAGAAAGRTGGRRCQVGGRGEGQRTRSEPSGAKSRTSAAEASWAAGPGLSSPLEAGPLVAAGTVALAADDARAAGTGAA